MKSTPKKRTQGMNWIRQEKRLALYLRDGLACTYCGVGVEQGAILTLDHVKPYSVGGSNEASNLVTACGRCNSSRGARTMKAWSAAVAIYLNHGVTAAEIIARVKASTRRPFDVNAAKEMIALRGSAARVVSA
jgi:HNH endonuclease